MTLIAINYYILNNDIMFLLQKFLFLQLLRMVKKRGVIDNSCYCDFHFAYNMASSTRILEEFLRDLESDKAKINTSATTRDSFNNVPNVAATLPGPTSIDTISEDTRHQLAGAADSRTIIRRQRGVPSRPREQKNQDGKEVKNPPIANNFAEPRKHLQSFDDFDVAIERSKIEVSGAGSTLADVEIQKAIERSIAESSSQSTVPKTSPPSYQKYLSVARKIPSAYSDSVPASLSPRYWYYIAKTASHTKRASYTCIDVNGDLTLTINLLNVTIDSEGVMSLLETRRFIVDKSATTIADNANGGTITVDHKSQQFIYKGSDKPSTVLAFYTDMKGIVHKLSPL